MQPGRRRRVALQQMTQDASEAGLYADTAEDYTAALKRARKKLARQKTDRACAQPVALFPARLGKPST